MPKQQLQMHSDLPSDMQRKIILYVNTSPTASNRRENITGPHTCELLLYHGDMLNRAECFLPKITTFKATYQREIVCRLARPELRRNASTRLETDPHKTHESLSQAMRNAQDTKTFRCWSSLPGSPQPVSVTLTAHPPAADRLRFSGRLPIINGTICAQNTFLLALIRTIKCRSCINGINLQ